MPRPPNVAVGGPGIREAPFRVSPWQQARRGPRGSGGGAPGPAAADTAATTTADADANGQSDADEGPPSPAVSGGSSAEEEPLSTSVRLAGPALFAYYPPGVVPPPIPGVGADPPVGEAAVAGRLVDDEKGESSVVWVVGAALRDGSSDLAGNPTDCSFSAGDRLLALGLYGPPGGGGHVTALLAQASGGDGASLVAPAPDGPRGRSARALLCGAGCAPARGPAPRLRFVCETLLAGPDAATYLSCTAPELSTSPPPLLNTGRFELVGWTGFNEGEAAHGAPAHGAPPARYGPDDPRFDPELDGDGGQE